MKRIIYIFLFVFSLQAHATGNTEKVNEEWQKIILEAINSFPLNGGYYTGGKPNTIFPTTAWQGLHQAFQMGINDKRPFFDPAIAQPSFCSLATYAVLIKALTMWDKKGKICREAWVNMKPYLGMADDLNPDTFGQDDGVGFWGRCNANGPSMGVLIHELKAGFSYTAFRGAKSEQNKETPDEVYLSDEEWNNDPIWQHAVPGDFMKIFWDRNASRGRDNGAVLGVDGIRGHDQEAGHSVVFIGYNNKGQVLYWSSNGPGKNPETMGYGIGTCNKTDIQRIVITRIMKPQNFNKVKKIKPNDINQYLFDLNGKKHSTTAELKLQCGIK